MGLSNNFKDVKKNLLLLILFLISSFIHSQTIQVFAEYSYIGNEKQSTKEVESEALNHAKDKALSKAGINEVVKTYVSLYKRTENLDFNKSLTSNFLSEKQGAVTSYEIIEKNNTYTNELPTCYIKIKANVIKYATEIDYNYKAIISGLSQSYTYDNESVKNKKNPDDGSAVKFSFSPTKDTYLTIFTLWDDEIYMLFPNEQEGIRANRDRNTIFKRDNIYDFGNDPEIWFDSPDKKNTGFRLIFVIHKESNKFYEKLNIDNMWKWFHEMPRDIRNVIIKDFTVYNQK